MAVAIYRINISFESEASMKKYKRILIAIIILLIISGITLHFCCYMHVGLHYTASQEYLFPEYPQDSLLDSKEIHHILNESYIEIDGKAGFSSRALVTVHTVQPQNWRNIYATYALWRTYSVDTTSVGDLHLGLVQSAVDWEGILTPQEIYHLLLLCGYLSLDVDKDLVCKKIEDCFDTEYGMYIYRREEENPTEARLVSASYYALQAYALLSIKCPNEDQLVKKLLHMSVDESSEGGADVCQYIILLHLLQQDLSDIPKQSTLLKRMELEEQNLCTSFKGTAEDAVSLLTIEFFLRANIALGRSNACWSKVIADRQSTSLLSEALNSVELLQAAIHIDKLLPQDKELYGAVKSDVAEYVIETLNANFYPVNDVGSINTMDIYYGTALSDLCGFSYNKALVKCTVESIVNSYLRGGDNQFLFLYFGVLCYKSLDMTIDLGTRRDIIEICREALQMTNQSFDLDSIPAQLDEAWFACETMELLGALPDMEERRYMRDLAEYTLSSELSHTSYVSEAGLLLNYLQDEQVHIDWKSLMDTLYRNGGFASTPNEDNPASIIATAKLLRLSVLRDLVDKSELVEFLNAHVIDGRLTYGSKEDCADLRTYYFYLRLLSEV